MVCASCEDVRDRVEIEASRAISSTKHLAMQSFILKLLFNPYTYYRVGPAGTQLIQF